MGKSKGNYERARQLRERRLLSEEAYANMLADFQIEENGLDKALASPPDGRGSSFKNTCVGALRWNRSRNSRQRGASGGWSGQRELRHQPHDIRETSPASSSFRK
jgi:hypothetical protein